MPKVNPLIKKAVIVDLTISAWSGKKQDKRVRDEVAAKHQTSIRAGTYIKNLARSSAIDDFRTLSNEIRTYHRQMTLPWDDGRRILPSSLFFQYNETMHSFKAETTRIISLIAQSRDEMMERAKGELRTLFNENDYPSEEELRNKFAFTFEFSPIAPSGNWPEFLSKYETQLSNSYEDMLNEKLQSGTEHLMNRFREGVELVRDRCLDNNSVIRAAIFNNLETLCEAAPGLNLSEDATLTEVINRTRAEITKWDPETVRHDMAVRSRVAANAASILSLL